MKQPTNHRSNTTWTESDLNMLTEMYARDVPVKTIAQALGRSEPAVYKAAHNNGIKRPAKNSPQYDLFKLSDDAPAQAARPVIDAIDDMVVERTIPQEYYTAEWAREYDRKLNVVIGLSCVAVCALVTYLVVGGV